MADFEPQSNYTPPYPLENILSRKIFSGGYVSGKTEFDDVVTNSIRFGGYFVRVKVGENINTAINKVYDNGGGTVYLEAGTHKPNYNIELKSSVAIEGQSAKTTIIDFNSQNFQIQIVGTNTYTTGTVTATYGDATITGALTVWTSAMEGRYILLDGLWYLISTVTDQTHLEISTVYIGQEIVGYGYAIATRIEQTQLVNFMVKNSGIAAVKVAYAQETYLYNVEVYTSNVGYDFDYVSNNQYEKCDIYYMASDGIQINYGGSMTFRESGILACGGNGLTLNYVTNSVLHDNFIFGNVDGLNMTNCTAFGVAGSTLSRNSSNGIELVSGCSGVSIIHTGCFNNGDSGIKLTATDDYNSVTSCILHSNGAYGWNIAANTCDNNVMIANNFYNNTSGTYNDSGTGTVLVSAG